MRVAGRQRKGGVGGTDISRKWAIKAGKHLCPQDFCSASLLIQVFLLLAPGFACCSSPWASTGALDTVGGISLASLPLSELPCKLSDLPVTQEDEMISDHEYLLSSPVLLRCFQSCCFPALLSRVVRCVFPKQRLPGLLCSMVVSLGDLMLRFQCHLAVVSYCK